MKKITFLILILLSFTTTKAQRKIKIENYYETASHFRNKIQLTNANYPKADVYQIFRKGGSGFRTVEFVIRDATQRIRDFAAERGRSFIILAQQTSSDAANKLLGTSPRVEIVFALIDN